MEKDDTPLAVMLQQSQNYTTHQLDIIHSDKTDYRPAEIKDTYQRALRYNDENALSRLINKFDFTALYDDCDILPPIEKQKVDAYFDDIFQMIKEVNPAIDKAKIEKAWNRANQRSQVIEERVYGGKHHSDCFIKENDQVYFLVSKFLEKLPDIHLIELLRETGNLTYKKRREIKKYKVRNIVNTDNIKDVIVAFMRNTNIYYPMPAQDICDIESGLIQIRK